MEKKSFLSGISAKIALSIVALSGALFAGCYQDDGLDVNGVKLPDPTYTISGQVVDAETLAPIASATVSGDVSATVVNGTFSVSVPSPKTYSLSVKGVSGYEDATVSVDVKEVNQGQSAVYSTLIALQPKYEGLYTLNIIAADVDGNTISGATYTIKEVGATAESTNGKLEGGKTYVVSVSADGYVQSNVAVDLPKVKTNTTKDVYVTLSKEVAGTVKISGEVKIADKTFSAQKIELKKDGVLLGIDEGYTYNFEVSDTYFTVATRAEATKSATFDMTIVDNNGVEVSFQKTFSVSASGEGTNQAANDDVNITVVYSDETTTGTVESVVKTFTNACNNEETTKNVAIKYNTLSGTKIEDGYTSLLSAAGITASNSNFYNPIIAALNPQGVTATELTWGEEATDKSYVLAALSELQSITIEYLGSTVTRSITGFQVDEKDVEIAALQSLVGAKAALTTADGSINLTNDVVINVGHGHSHGHGADNNAGGGIITAE